MRKSYLLLLMSGGLSFVSAGLVSCIRPAIEIQPVFHRTSVSASAFVVQQTD